MSDEQTTTEPLYTNEQIAWYADNSPTAWEAKHVHDAMVKVRDFYEAELAKVRAQLAEQWQPVEAGEYKDLIGRKIYIEQDGERFGMDTPYYDCDTGEWSDLPCYVDMYDVRLCRRKAKE